MNLRWVEQPSTWFLVDDSRPNPHHVVGTVAKEPGRDGLHEGVLRFSTVVMVSQGADGLTFKELGTEIYRVCGLHVDDTKEAVERRYREGQLAAVELVVGEVDL